MTTTGEQRVSAQSSHTSTATADGSAATGDPGVGIAIAIAISLVSAEAYVSSAADLTAGEPDARGRERVRRDLRGDCDRRRLALDRHGGRRRFALHVLVQRDPGPLMPGTTVTVGGGRVTDRALGDREHGQGAAAGTSTTGDLGIGAAFALNIVDDQTGRGLRTPRLSGADDLSLTATSTDAMITEARAGASADTAIVPAVAISISNVNTDATSAGAPSSRSTASWQPGHADRDRGHRRSRAGRVRQRCRRGDRSDLRPAPGDRDDGSVADSRRAHHLRRAGLLRDGVGGSREHRRGARHRLRTR